ncbi:LacI family DNA-binding transcriptional regulator [Paenibacillus sacheonensis]|uniref:Substrate-binding domain-containing protein n=1 Tax=Paenibacillus sacheonensis TaxID=742054 RepID=A0A7X4YQ53_9BACL|nr:LacI family DNA-binding transcriptional regulator [Paenibacillus sacheonensis]MBM7565557.1 LacI family transcriptional regulator [Paenibacillus sacheonensis]NBC69524.1 substrate-binding domain-containing protein [Paenibacillus sacheonensis]
MSKATIKQVAAEANVSTATVSRVLNDSGYVSAEVKSRVFGAIAKMNYQPSAIARSLKQDRTYMIGIIVPDISNPYFMGISRGIEDVVGPEGFQLMFCSAGEVPEKEARLLQLLHEKRVDVIVLATSGGNVATINALIDNGQRMLLIDRRLEASETAMESDTAADSDTATDSDTTNDSESVTAIPPALDLVAEDNVRIAYELTKALLEDGHVRIGVVNGPTRVSTGRDRLEGVLRAMKEYGAEDRLLLYSGDFSTEGGIRAVRQFLGEPVKPTAIVSLNNKMSLGVLLELVQSGLRIPGDMAVASFGEVEAGRLLKEPGLYYVDQRPYEMGQRAGELVLRLLRGEGGEREPASEIFHHEVMRIR